MFLITKYSQLEISFDNFWDISFDNFWDISFDNFGKIWLQLQKYWKKLIKPIFPHFSEFFCVV